MRKINAAPGEIPFAINDNATGIDAVLQTYIGIPMSNITGKATQSFPNHDSSKK